MQVNLDLAAMGDNFQNRGLAIKFNARRELPKKAEVWRLLVDLEITNHRSPTWRLLQWLERHRYVSMTIREQNHLRFAQTDLTLLFSYDILKHVALDKIADPALRKNHNMDDPLYTYNDFGIWCVTEYAHRLGFNADAHRAGTFMNVITEKSERMLAIPDPENWSLIMFQEVDGGNTLTESNWQYVQVKMKKWFPEEDNYYIEYLDLYNLPTQVGYAVRTWQADGITTSEYEALKDYYRRAMQPTVMDKDDYDQRLTADLRAAIKRHKPENVHESWGDDWVSLVLNYLRRRKKKIAVDKFGNIKPIKAKWVENAVKMTGVDRPKL